jgi:hypothetical protein
MLTKIAPMGQQASVTKTGQNSSLRAIRWAVAVEGQALSAAVGDAMREVMNAERLLAGGLDVTHAARYLNAWTAILDSRITRLNSFELRHRSRKLDAHSPSAWQYGDDFLPRSTNEPASTGLGPSIEMKTLTSEEL